MEERASPAFPSLPTRLVNVFFSPGELFEGLKGKPAWGGVLMVGAGLSLLAVFLIPGEIWVGAMREQAMEQGSDLPAFMESAGPVFRLLTAGGGLIFWFVWAFLLAGIYTFVFAFVFGDEGRYTEYLTVVGHALFISAVGALLLVPLRIYQEDPSLTLNLGTFLPVLREGYGYRVLKLLDLFALWSYAVMAIGATKIDPRRGLGSALAFSWGFALVFALVIGTFAG